MAHGLFAALDAALAGAVGDMCIVCTELVVLALAAAMSLHTPRHAAAGARGPDKQGHGAA